MTKDLEYILPKVDVTLLEQELNSDRYIRNTNKLDNEIYIINHHNSPNVMREIGRLRELTFASSGGGTGLPIDIDDLDTCENCYQQLIIWAPEDSPPWKRPLIFTLYPRLLKMSATHSVYCGLQL